MDHKQPIMCEICNVPVHKNDYEVHVQGKNHQILLHRVHVSKERERNGIFVTGLPHQFESKNLLSYFSKFGEIVDYFTGENNKFIIIQFSNNTAAEEALKATHHFMGKQIFVRPRKLKEVEKKNFESNRPTEDFDLINSKLKNINNFDEQVACLLHYVQPNWHVMHNKYKHLCYDLEYSLKMAFPVCRVHPFGSTIIGLDFNTSDVDAYVEIPPYPDKSEHAINHIINKSKSVLNRSRLFTNIIGIPKAKTPIVKCVHIPTNISCDFNFKNMLGVCNTYLIKYYLSLDSKLRPMMMILKYWAKVHELSISRGQKLSNYSLVMLLIFYLQQEPFKFPTVESLQRSPECLNLQEGWNGGFLATNDFDDTAIRDQTLPQLLHGFFTYYTNYNYSMNIICPFNGSITKKIDFIKPDSLPECFFRYQMNLEKNGPLKVETPICIQDPFELTRNTAAGVSSKSLEEFIQLCNLGMTIMSSKDNNCSLYKLFTEEPDPSLMQKSMFSDNECKFKLPMGSCLKYVEKKLDNDNNNVEKQILKVWFETVSQFVLSVLVGALKFDIVVSKDVTCGKSQRLTGQQDVHDTNIFDRMSLTGSGKYNLWEARRSISRDVQLDLPPNSTLLNREIALSDYIRNILFKDITLTENIVEFNLDMYAKCNPNEIEFHLKKINSSQRYFQTFSKFLADKLPLWFNLHEKNLNNLCDKENETDELINNTNKDDAKNTEDEHNVQSQKDVC